MRVLCVLGAVICCHLVHGYHIDSSKSIRTKNPYSGRYSARNSNFDDAYYYNDEQYDAYEKAAANLLRAQEEFAIAQQILDSDHFDEEEPMSGKMCSIPGALKSINRNRKAKGLPLVTCREAPLTPFEKQCLTESGRPKASNRPSGSFHTTKCGKAIKAMAADVRPAPNTYFVASQIKAHRRLFGAAASSFMPADKLVEYVLGGRTKHHEADGTKVGRNGIQWVQPKSVQDKLIKAAREAAAKKGNPTDQSEIMWTEIEQPLGIPKGQWAGELIIQTVFEKLDSLHIPRGNEDGVNGEWQPGGYSGSQTLALKKWKPESVLEASDTTVKLLRFFVVYENGMFIEPREEPPAWIEGMDSGAGSSKPGRGQDLRNEFRKHVGLPQIPVIGG